VCQDVKPTLDDLVDAQPELGKGLLQLLSFEGDVEETYCRTFSVEHTDFFGQKNVIELKPGGKDIPLNNKNRKGVIK